MKLEVFYCNGFRILITHEEITNIESCKYTIEFRYGKKNAIR